MALSAPKGPDLVRYTLHGLAVKTAQYAYAATSCKQQSSKRLQAVCTETLECLHKGLQQTPSLEGICVHFFWQQQLWDPTAQTGSTGCQHDVLVSCCCQCLLFEDECPSAAELFYLRTIVTRLSVCPREVMVVVQERQMQPGGRQTQLRPGTATLMPRLEHCSSLQHAPE